MLNRLYPSRPGQKIECLFVSLNVFVDEFGENVFHFSFLDGSYDLQDIPLFFWYADGCRRHFVVPPPSSIGYEALSVNHPPGMSALHPESADPPEMLEYSKPNQIFTSLSQSAKPSGTHR